MVESGGKGEGRREGGVRECGFVVENLIELELQCSPVDPEVMIG